MARLLGDAVLPEQVQSRRRSLRNRVTELRQPVRNFREQNVPGPDIVGMVESNVSDLRDRFVSRSSVLERIRDRRDGGGMMPGGQSGESGNGQGSASGSSSGSSSSMSSGSDKRTVN